VSHSSSYDAMAAAKLSSMGRSYGPAVEDIKRRLRDNLLVNSDVVPIAERLAENQLWPAVDRLTKDDLLPQAEYDRLRSTYFKMGRPTWQLFDEAFFRLLNSTKLDSRATKLVDIASFLLKEGFKEVSLACLLRVVEGILTDLCLQSLNELEQHKDTLQAAPNNLEVNKYKIENEWGLYAKALALNEVKVINEVTFRQLHDDLNDPRNKLSHSYVSLPERDIEDLIREIFTMIPTLATLIT
jgi:hypothetical protein